MSYKNYFAYESFPSLNYSELKLIVNEETVLEAESYLKSINQDTSNIYFKLLAHILLLEKESQNNLEMIAYLNYLIAYYIGLFYHPNQGDLIALNYLEKALSQTEDKELIARCIDLEKMIKEEEIED